MQPAPTFGRRSAPVKATRAVAPATPVALAPAHAAIFAAARAEIEEAPQQRAVPRSFRAALLAGLVVGCCLAGLDVTRAGETLRTLSAGMLPDDAAPRLVPVIVLLGLFGGARAAATSLLIAHAVLRRCGLTTHLAYAIGGAMVAAAFSSLAAAVAQIGLAETLPTHGLALDIAAGAGAGFFYRVFAGAAPVR